MSGEDLKKWRLRSGMKQSELAELLGVSMNTISRWELGNVPIPPYLHLSLRQIESDLKKKARTA